MGLTIIGTSHISSQSIKEIEEHIINEKPDIIAVELDFHRARSLIQGQKKASLFDMLKLGSVGFLFGIIGKFVQEKLGKIVGVKPGSEMKTALILSAKHKIPVSFIDQPIQITLKNLTKQLTWREKGRFILDFLAGIFRPKKQVKKFGLEGFDLRKVPKQIMIEKMVQPLKERYPNVYKTLISDRDKYMSKKLLKLQKLHPEKKILAVVGAGHKSGMKKYLEKNNIS